MPAEAPAEVFQVHVKSCDYNSWNQRLEMTGRDHLCLSLSQAMHLAAGQASQPAFYAQTPDRLRQLVTPHCVEAIVRVISASGAEDIAVLRGTRYEPRCVYILNQGRISLELLADPSFAYLLK